MDEERAPLSAPTSKGDEPEAQKAAEHAAQPLYPRGMSDGEETSDGKAPRSGLDTLIAWANGQDHWVRAVVAEVIDTRQPLPSERIGHFYELLIQEKMVGGADAPIVPPLVPGDRPVDSADILQLSLIRDVAHVNRLAPGQSIKFNPHLTLLFGENATGKTGYVRILKQVASVRTAEPILSDVTRSQPAAGSPSAVIDYRLGSVDETCTWKGEKGVSPLTRMHVFDSKGVRIHVDEDLSYTYTPADLALFQLTHEALDAVRQRLEAARKEKTPAGNPFLSRFSRDSTIRSKIETLGPSTDIEELRQLSKVGKEERDTLQGLRERVDALASTNAKARLEVAAGQVSLFNSVLAVIDEVEKFSGKAYDDARTELASAVEANEATARESFAGDAIPGQLTQEWQRFIEAASDYIAATDAGYPSQDSSCIYCRQPLTDAALELVRKYQAYTSSERKKRLLDAQEALRQSRAMLDGLDLEGPSASVSQRSLQHPEDTLLPRIAEFLTLASSLKAHVGEVADAEAEPVLASGRALRTGVETQRDLATTTVEELSAQATNQAEILAKERRKLADLEARIMLEELIGDLEAHVSDAKWAQKAQTIVRGFAQLGRSITTASKDASGQILNPGFQRRFETECQALRAPEVRLAFPGRDAAAKRSKSVGSSTRLSDVLSEGEQKVVALAGFSGVSGNLCTGSGCPG